MPSAKTASAPPAWRARGVATTGRCDGGHTEVVLPSSLRAVARSATRLRGRNEVWRLDLDAGDAVVARHREVRSGIAAIDVATRLAWVHQFLRRVEPEGISVPTPVPLLAGSAIVTDDGAVWETLTYLPGRVVGWRRRPTMYELGATLARFHDASAALALDGDGGGPTPVSALARGAAAPPADLDAAVSDVRIRAVEELRSGLERVDHRHAAKSIIHGDCTNHNVLTSGAPEHPSGLIDFSNTYCEATLADIGFALWRSGRPSQRAIEFSPARIAAYLSGYASRRPLASRDIDSVLVYLHARGLQILDKQARHASAVDPPLVARLAWLHDHHRQLHDAVSQRLRRRAD